MSRLKGFLSKDTVHVFLIFFSLFIFMILFLYISGCALLTDNISSCHRACGKDMMLVYDDGNCTCKNAL